MKSHVFIIIAVIGFLLTMVFGAVAILSSPAHTGTVTIVKENQTRKHCVVDVVTANGENMEIRLGKGRVCRDIEEGQTVELENGRLAN